MGRRHRKADAGRWAGCLSGAVLLHAAAALGFGAGTATAPESTADPQRVWIAIAATDPNAGDRGESEAAPVGVPADTEAPSAAEADPHARQTRLARTAPRRNVRAAPPEAPIAPDAAEAEAAARMDEGSDGRANGNAPTHGSGSDDGHADDRGQGNGGKGTVHGPRLLARGDPCAGYYPFDAKAERGQVELDITVDPAGAPLDARVLEEMPRRQGFGQAARACAARLRFAPARDGRGHPIAEHATIRVRFARHIR